MKKEKEQQLKKYADDFGACRDAIKTPAWRMLVEEPLAREMDWCEREISAKVLGPGATIPVEELRELKAYQRALGFVLDQVLQRIRVGSECLKTLRQRAVELGLAEEDKFEVPKFQEVR